MEKNIEITLLYDIYGKLLTEKQRSIFEEYYLFNLSLREIAENKKISYQAVRDSIKNTEQSLKHFEENIKMYALLEKVEFAYKLCKQDINQNKEEIMKLLKSEDDN